MNFFTTRSAQIRKKTLSAIQQSPSCAGMHDRFDQTLALTDRLICSCIGDASFGDLPRRLEKVLLHIGNSKDRLAAPGTDVIKDCCEAFLKVVLFRVDPSRYQALQTASKGLTLFPVIKELQILSQQELETPLSNATNLGDRAKAAALIVRYLRNEVSHTAPEYESGVDEANLNAALLTMLAAVDKHREALRTALRNLVVSTLESAEQANDTLSMVRSERDRHLRKFKGREDVLAEVKSRIEERVINEGGYMLVTAPEGFGKSALAARLSELLQQTPICSQSSGLDDGAKTCPWLPGVIYHTGKQAFSISHFIETVIRQANCLLIRPVEFDRTQIEERIGPSSAAITFPGLQGESFTNPDAVDEHRGGTSSKRIEKKSDSAEARLALRAALYSCLERLAEERGQMILILDSLDELNLTAPDVSLFPQALPRGVVALLISRDVHATTEIRRHLRPSEYVLKGLSIEEVRQLTQVNDETWNETALRSSRGAPLYLLTLADAVRRAGGDYLQVDPSVGPSEILDRQAKQWRLPEREEKDDPLYNAMLLLSVFEPVSPLDIDLIKGFLLSCGLNLSRSQIREMLREVSSQIDGLSEGKVKLAVRAFAFHVCNEICGKKDLRTFILRVSQWLSNEEDASAKTIAAFLKYWTDAKMTLDSAQRENAKKLVFFLNESKNFNRLYDIYSSRPADEEDETPDVFLICLRMSAEGGHLRAARALGDRLVFNNDHGEDAWEEGERWLRTAMSMGDELAHVLLGIHLLYSLDNPDRIAEGERLAREAVEHGDLSAAVMLGSMYLDGFKLARDSIEGERLLYQAAAAGSYKAMSTIGNRLLSGKGLAQDLVRGESLLREAAAGGEHGAMLSLGRRLLEGRGLAKSEVEGEGWLVKLANDGDTETMIEMGARHLNGDGLPKDVNRGVEWFRKAISEGDASAMLALGARYIDGEGVPQMQADGERLLREAVKKSHLPAMLALALRLIDGDGLKKSAVEGRQLLFKAAQRRYAPAMAIYGERLLDGEDFKQDVAEGYKWLQMAAKARLPSAMCDLGVRIVRGEIAGQSKMTGEEWLRKAIKHGSTRAKISLGEFILDGQITSTVPNEGYTLIESAAEEGSVTAMSELAYRMCIGEGLAVDDVKSDYWLEKATSKEMKNNNAATGITYYLRGRTRGVVSDLEMAASIFLAKTKEDSAMASNLAYMARRKETGEIQGVPPLDELLEKGLAGNESFALVNEALRRASGVDCVVDWHRADNLIARLRLKKDLSSIRDALNWWSLMIAKFGDGEGHLVVGMLVRHGLVRDPRNISACERLLKAREKSWDVPDWMLSVTVGKLA